MSYFEDIDARLGGHDDVADIDDAAAYEIVRTEHEHAMAESAIVVNRYLAPRDYKCGRCGGTIRKGDPMLTAYDGTHVVSGHVVCPIYGDGAAVARRLMEEIA